MNKPRKKQQEIIEFLPRFFQETDSSHLGYQGFSGDPDKDIEALCCNLDGRVATPSCDVNDVDKVVRLIDDCHLKPPSEESSSEESSSEESSSELLTPVRNLTPAAIRLFQSFPLKVQSDVMRQAVRNADVRGGKWVETKDFSVIPDPSAKKQLSSFASKISGLPEDEVCLETALKEMPHLCKIVKDAEMNAKRRGSLCIEMQDLPPLSSVSPRPSVSRRTRTKKTLNATRRLY